MENDPREGRFDIPVHLDPRDPKTDPPARKKAFKMAKNCTVEGVPPKADRGAWGLTLGKVFGLLCEACLDNDRLQMQLLLSEVAATAVAWMRDEVGVVGNWKAIRAERHRQMGKWGPGRHVGDKGRWTQILGEEVGEAHDAALQTITHGEDHQGHLVKELTEVAAVSLSWLEEEIRVYGNA